MKLTTERTLFYLFCVLSAAPLLFSHYPPMIDLPQHAAQVATFNRLTSPDFVFRDLFVLNWTTPYLGGYFTLWLLSLAMPLLIAIKLVLGLVIMAIPLVTSRLRAHFHGDPAWDWLMLPIGYGFAFQWGFFNFLFGVPIVLLFLLSLIHFSEKPRFTTGCWLALFALLLYPLHVLIALFGCGLGFLYVVTSDLPRKTRLPALLTFVVPVILAVIWQAVQLAAGGQSTDDGPWQLSWVRPVEFLASAIGATPSNTTDRAIGALVFALPFLLGARLVKHLPRLMMLGAFLLWMMLGPSFLFGNMFTYQRFAVFGLPLLILALRPSEEPPNRARHYLRSLYYILPVALLLTTCLRFASFDLEARGYEKIAASMKADKRVLMLTVDKRSKTFELPMFLHFPAWYQAESTGIVDFSFSSFGVLVSYKPDAGIPIPRGFEWSSEAFDWTGHKGWLYDYFVVRYPEDLGPMFFSAADCPVRLLARSGSWWLYETQLGGAAAPNDCDLRRQQFNKRD